MILDLTNSLFKQDPFEVFKEYGISREEWENIWYKSKFLEYKPRELSEYLRHILHKEVNDKQLSRFLMRYEVYILTQPLINRKDQTIHISYYPKNVISFIKDYYHEITTRTDKRNVPRDDTEIPCREEDGIQATSD